MARARAAVLCVSILSLLSGTLAARSIELLYQDNTGDTA